jgi:hypothetical protein
MSDNEGNFKLFAATYLQPYVMLQIGASLTDDSVGVIYNCNIFIIQVFTLWPEKTCSKFFSLSFFNLDWKFL